MAFNWFKKIVKDYPKFWETYLSYFDEIQDKKKRFVVFDCETTGLDYKSDRILSIGAVAIENNQVIVGDFMEVFLQQDIFKAESVPIHGILKEGKEEKIVEAEAIIRFLEFIKDDISPTFVEIGTTPNAIPSRITIGNPSLNDVIRRVSFSE